MKHSEENAKRRNNHHADIIKKYTGVRNNSRKSMVNIAIAPGLFPSTLLRWAPLNGLPFDCFAADNALKINPIADCKTIRSTG